MRAAVCTGYGGLEVLEVREVLKPSPKDNQILLKIKATSVTSGDARIRRADPFLIRLIFGFKKPRKSVLGVVVAGEVESIGKDVTKYKVGDKLFGSCGMSFGAHAEYQCISEDGVLATIPNGMTYKEAAAIPFGASASRHFLELGNITEGQKVLIYGASGALGTAAIQLAKLYGAEVTAVCSAENETLVLSLGADKMIDYKTEDFSKNGVQYDVVFDTVGKSTLKQSLEALQANGVLLMASADFSTMIRGAVASLFGSRKVKSGVIKETVEDMNFFKKLIEKGQLKAVIDRSFSLDQIAAAHAHVDSGHKRGNVIVTM